MDTKDFQDMHWLLDVVQSTDIGIVILDRDYKVDVFNQFMQVHSDLDPEQVIGNSLFDSFPYLNDEWFTRRVNTVFNLGVPVYTTWEQRDNVFDFRLKLPIQHLADRMYQNTTFIPLRSSADEVVRVGVIVYDVTTMASNKQALEAARDELLLLSRTDRLTGLCNRGYWEECLQAEFRRHQRSGEPASLVMFDIDHFKRINDNYGHHVGDDVIRHVATTLQELSREVDITGRYGGEEYVAILPYTDEQGALVFAERLREAIAQHVLVSHGHELKFTISMGVAFLTPETRNYYAWLVNADGALYQSKEAGRNCSTVYRA